MLIPVEKGNIFVKFKFNFMGKIHNLNYNVLVSEISFQPVDGREKLKSMLNN